MEMTSPAAVNVYILAGGKSLRMGTDKAFVEVDGENLLARALDLARSVSSDVCIVGSRDKFARFAPVVEDIFHDHGPLAGIHAALRASRRELNLVLAVDTPWISQAFLRYVIRQAEDAPQATVVVPRSAGRLQPLCALYRREFAEVAESALASGHNKIDPLFAVVQARVIEEQELERAGFSPSMFRNLNTPEELEAEK
jgi:molybdenum cofactor guanylyltransferase